MTILVVVDMPEPVPADPADSADSDFAAPDADGGEDGGGLDFGGDAVFGADFP